MILFLTMINNGDNSTPKNFFLDSEPKLGRYVWSSYFTTLTMLVGHFSPPPPHAPLSSFKDVGKIGPVFSQLGFPVSALVDVHHGV